MQVPRALGCLPGRQGARSGAQRLYLFTSRFRRRLTSGIFLIVPRLHHDAAEPKSAFCNSPMRTWSGRADSNRGPSAPKVRARTLSSWFVLHFSRIRASDTSLGLLGTILVMVGLDHFGIADDSLRTKTICSSLDELAYIRNNCAALPRPILARSASLIAA